MEYILNESGLKSNESHFLNLHRIREIASGKVLYYLLILHERFCNDIVENYLRGPRAKEKKRENGGRPCGEGEKKGGRKIDKYQCKERKEL